ncbi:MAG: MBL fold metallo-hydrolase [Thermoprotei archaeon]|nr:MBL fold metallo-hydrolase [Thermoprotei archaeon]
MSFNIKAGVTRRGAILLGENFTVDGHSRRPVRVVTHIHSDHTIGLDKSVRESMLIAGTTYTIELLEILGYRVHEAKTLPLEYWKPVELVGEKLTLIPSNHIVGSCQVMVEGPDYRVGYTGDFKMPDTPPMTDLDVLVIDATYGSPRLQRRWSDWDAMAALISLIEDSIKKGPVTIYAYHGKIQEIMAELRVRGVKEPFIADRKTIKIARVAEKFYNVNLDPLKHFAEHDEGEPVIIFKHTNNNKEISSKGIHIVLTGWELRAPLVKITENLYNIGFSDHATFKEIIDYVKESKPKKVIVDSTRGKDTRITAKYIEKILGITATNETIPTSE